MVDTQERLIWLKKMVIHMLHKSPEVVLLHGWRTSLNDSREASSIGRGFASQGIVLLPIFF